MVQNADPDVFARHRLFQRTVTVLVAQAVAAAASADQIYQLIEWSDMVNYEIRLRSLEESIRCNSSSFHPEAKSLPNRTVCCDNRYIKALILAAFKSFEDAKDAGLASFIIVFALSLTGFILTLTNYLGFIKSKSQYLRKFAINAIVFLAFVAQCVSCASFDSGMKSKLEASQSYCEFLDVEPPVANIVQQCLPSVLKCPNSSLLYGYLVIMIVTTSLIPIVAIYSCKWRERAFAGLAEEIAFRRKPDLFSLQRSMLHNVKTELELEQEFHRRTLQQLEENLVEEYETLRAYERSLQTHPASNEPDVKNAMAEELHHYIEKLTDYNHQLASVMNKSEALAELRKLDLDILKQYTKYLNALQKLPVNPQPDEEEETEPVETKNGALGINEDDLTNQNVATD